MKFSSFFTTLALLFAVPAGAFAQEYYDGFTEYETDLTQNTAPEEFAPATHLSGFGGSVFYAESAGSYFKDDPDFYGLNLCYSIRQIPASNEPQTLSPEFFISGGFGFGCGDAYKVNYGYKESFLEYEVRHFMCTLGANLRYNIGSAFSLYVGARMGGEAILFSVDYGNHDTDQEYDLGLTYGWGMGCSLAFSENFAMNFGVERLSTEAAPEVDGIYLGSQTYTVYSLGFTISF